MRLLFFSNHLCAKACGLKRDKKLFRKAESALLAFKTADLRVYSQNSAIANHAV
jgi:hypothetical protein